MAIKIDINFQPNAGNLRAFLKELQKSLNELGIDTSAFSADDLADVFESASVYAGEFDSKISDIEKKLEDLNKTTEENKDNFATMFKFDAFGKAGEFIGGLSEKFSESADELRLMGVRAGVTGSDLDKLKSSAREIYVDSRAFDSFKDAAETISIAKRELKDFLAPDELAIFAQRAKEIGDTWGRDVTEVIEKSAPAIKNFGIQSGEAAANYIALLQQNGAEDSLDSLNEYSQLAVGIFGKGEDAAAQFFGTIIQGAKEGARDSDKLVDTLKETQLRINAGDATKALADISEPVARQLEGITALAQGGSISIAQATKEAAEAIQTAFDAGQITDSMRQQLQVAISGTPAEDLGTELYSRIFTAEIDPAAIQTQAALAGLQLSNAFDTNIPEKVSKAFSAAFESIGGAIAPILGPASSLLTTTSQLGPALSFAKNFGTYAKEAGEFGKAILSKIVPSLFTEVAAKEAGTAAQLKFNLAALANPYILIGAAIFAGAIAAFALLHDSVKSAEEATEDLNNATEKFTEASDNEKLVKKNSDEIRKLADEYDNLKGKTDPESQARFAKVSEELAAKVPTARESIEQLNAAGQRIGSTFTISTNEARKFADETARLAEEAKNDSFASQTDQVQAAVDTWHSLREDIADATEERNRYQELEDAGLGNRVAGGDWETVSTNLKDARGELQGLREDEEKVTAGLNEFIKAQVNSGASVQDIAERTGLAVDEVKYLSAEFIGAKAEADQIGGELKKQGDEIAKNTAEVKKYGTAFEEATKQAADLSSASINALAQSLANLDAAKKAGDAERVAALEAQVKLFTDTARNAVQNEQQLGTYLKRAEELSGKVVKKTTTKTAREKSVISIANTVEDLIKQLNNEIVLSSLTDELEVELEKVNQKQEQELEKLNKQYEDFAKKIEESKKKDATFKVVDPKELDRLKKEGEVYNKIIDKFNLEREQSAFEFFKKRLAEQQAIEKEDVERKIESLEDEANRLDATTARGLRRREELLLKSLLLQSNLERSSIVKSNDSYIKLFAERAKAERDINLATSEEERRLAETRAGDLENSLKKEEESLLATAQEMLSLRDLEESLRSGLTDEERKAAEEQIKIINEKLSTINDDTRRTSEELLLSLLSDRDKEIEIRKELSQFRYDQEVTKLKEIHTQAEAELQKHNESVLRLVGTLSEVSKSRGLDLIAERESSALDALETMRAKDLLTEQQYENRKVELTRAAETERAALEARTTGFSLEAQRQAQLEELKQQYISIGELFTAAVDAGDFETQKQLQKQLDEIEKTIVEKSDVISGVTEELQANITELFTNLVSADEEDIKRPFKKVFLTLVGALQRLGSAKITEVLLGSISGALGLPGLLATVGLRPAIEGIINGLLTPLFDNLASFGEGSPPLTSPQLAIVGDATVPEYVLRQDQLGLLMIEAAMLSSAGIIPLLKELIELFRNYPDRIRISRRDVFDAYNKHAAESGVGLVG